MYILETYCRLYLIKPIDEKKFNYIIMSRNL